MSAVAPHNIPLYSFINRDLQRFIDRSETQQFWAESIEAVTKVAMVYFTILAVISIGMLTPAYMTCASCCIMFDLYLEASNSGLFALFNSFVLEPLHETVLITTENTERLQATQTIALEIGTLNDAQIEARLDSLEFDPQMIDRSVISSLSILRNPIAGYERFKTEMQETYDNSLRRIGLATRFDYYLDLLDGTYQYNNSDEGFTTIVRTNLPDDFFANQPHFEEILREDIQIIKSFGNPDYIEPLLYLEKIYLGESRSDSEMSLEDLLQPQHIINIKNQATIIKQRLHSNAFNQIIKAGIYKIKAAFMAYIIMCPTETRTMCLTNNQANRPAFGHLHSEVAELHRRQRHEIGYGPLFSTFTGRVFTLEDIQSRSIQDLAVRIFGQEPIPNTEAPLGQAGSLLTRPL